MLLFARQDLILALVGLRFWHDYCLSNLNFHTYNLAHKARKVKKNFQLFYCLILSWAKCIVQLFKWANWRGICTAVL